MPRTPPAAHFLAHPHLVPIGHTPVISSLLALLTLESIISQFLLGLGGQVPSFHVKGVLAGEWWRLFSWLRPGPSLPSLLVLVFLLVRWRSLERLLGSLRMATFLVLSFLLSLAIFSASQLLLSPTPLAGPWPLLGALYFLDLAINPSVQGSEISLGPLRLPVTEKLLPSLSLLAAATQGLSAAPTLLAGLVIGAFSYSLTLKLTSSFPTSTTGEVESAVRIARVPIAAHAVQPPGRPRLDLHQDPRIRQLLSMGFTVEEAIPALELTNMDVNEAITLLVDERRRR